MCYGGREGHDLRTIELDGEPWFHATDVCRILGLSTAGGTSSHTVRLAADEKMTLSKRTHGQTVGVVEFIGKAGMAAVVSQSGLYKLTLRSDKDTTRPFQDWVTKEVLPAIRRTGGYLLNEAARETADADTRSAMLVTL